jgi:dipeptidyl aminopeptidase/acylaminoacyl peptidase
VGGEPRQVTELPGLGGDPVWSPNGQQIACVVLINSDTTMNQENQLNQLYGEDVVLIDRLWYKLDSYGFLVHKFWHVFTINVFGPNKGKTQQLTAGQYQFSSPAWSPNGKYIAVSGNRIPKRFNLAIVNDIWIIPSGGGELTKLTNSQGPANHPTWSPDGKYIAYIGHNNQHGSYTFSGIWIISVGSGDIFELSKNFNYAIGDHSIGDLVGHDEPTIAPQWSLDSTYIYVCVSTFGAVHLWRISIANGEAIPLTSGNFVIYNVTFSKDVNHIAMGITTATLPNDIWIGQLDGDRIHVNKLTNVNEEWLANHTLTEPVRFTYQAKNGPVEEGWILYPSDQNKQKKEAIVLQIHGGPMAMYGYVFFFEFQLLAANGFTVVYPNPRGSFGYSQDFAKAIRGDWGNLVLLM